MGGIGNVVVKTIVRMFTKKAVGKAMKSAKKSAGTGRSKQVGGRKGRPKNRGAKDRTTTIGGTAGSRNEKTTARHSSKSK